MTAELTELEGTNMFESSKTFTIFSLEENFLEIAGCPLYSESQIANRPNLLTVSKILNIGWVKDTKPFKF